MSISKRGLEKLKKELALKNAELPKRQEEYMTAVGEGDGEHDNILWQKTKQSLELLQGRIIELEDAIRELEADSREYDDDVSTVSMGNTVTIVDAENKARQVRLTEEIEVRLSDINISEKSPLGVALMGKKKGAEVSIQTPMGEKKYKIRSIE